MKLVFVPRQESCFFDLIWIVTNIYTYNRRVADWSMSGISLCLSFFFHLCCRVRGQSQLPSVPGLILTPAQQSQARRLSAVYFVSVCSPRPWGQDANTYTPAHAYTHGYIHSLAHSITSRPCLKWMDDILAFHYSHLCFSLTAERHLISVLLCFVWYRATPMHFLFSILYCFLTQRLFCLSFLCMCVFVGFA